MVLTTEEERSDGRDSFLVGKLSNDGFQPSTYGAILFTCVNPDEFFPTAVVRGTDGGCRSESLCLCSSNH